MDSSVKVRLFGEILEALVDESLTSLELKRQYFKVISEAFEADIVTALIVDFQEVKDAGGEISELITQWQESVTSSLLIKSMISVVYCGEFKAPSGEKVTGNNYVYLNSLMWKLIHTTPPSLPSGSHTTWSQHPGDSL